VMHLHKRDSDTKKEEKKRTMQEKWRQVARGYPAFALDEKLPHLQTGDVVLFHGTERASRVIEWGTWSYWSHTMMLVRNPSPELVQMYSIQLYQDMKKGADLDIDFEKDGVYVFESDSDTFDKREKGGVQLVPLRLWMHENSKLYGDEMIMAVRHLNLPSRTGDDHQDFPKLEEFMRSVCGKSYEVHKKELYGSVHKLNKKDDLSSIFCSELVAASWKQMELVEEDAICSNFLPKDFSSEKGLFKRRCNCETLKREATLEPEFRLRWTPFDKPGTDDLKLHVEVIEARNLLAVHRRSGASDPYCKVDLDNFVQRTQVVKKDVNPHWSEKFTFDSPQSRNTLKIEIWDHNTLRPHTFLGVVSFDQNQMQEARDSKLVIERWLPLNDQENSPDKPRGEVHVRLYYRGSEP